MLYITAEKIHNGNQWLPAGSTLEVHEDGTIIAVHDHPVEHAVYYSGILTPGFVNAHCHLELSHMKGAIREHTGLVPFLQQVIRERNHYTEEQIKEARFQALVEMLDNGIVAVGDIANTNYAMDLRAMDKMHFCTFIEVLGFSEIVAGRSFGHALQVFHEYDAQKQGNFRLKQFITPHAPYSVSESLFRLIDGHKKDSIFCIHNQECLDEDLFYKDKTGRFREFLSSLGIDDSSFTPTGKSSIQSYLPWVSNDHPFIFVHNTVTQLADFQYVITHIRNAHWCLCPGANLYIENQLPDINMLYKEDAEICIGTDSLSSNHRLSIFNELLIIKAYFPHIPWEALIKWGTRNGAFALGLSDVIGTFEPGKKPGINNIKGILEQDQPPAVTRIL